MVSMDQSRLKFIAYIHRRARENFMVAHSRARPGPGQVDGRACRQMFGNRPESFADTHGIQAERRKNDDLWPACKNRFEAKEHARGSRKATQRYLQIYLMSQQEGPDGIV